MARHGIEFLCGHGCGYEKVQYLNSNKNRCLQVNAIPPLAPFSYETSPVFRWIATAAFALALSCNPAAAQDKMDVDEGVVGSGTATPNLKAGGEAKRVGQTAQAPTQQGGAGGGAKGKKKRAGKK